MSERKKIVISRPSVNPTPGSLARVTTASSSSASRHTEFGYCRDGFHSSDGNSLNHVMMWHELKQKQIAEFVLAVEKKMEHQRLSEFEDVFFVAPTGGKESACNLAISVKPAEFWKQNTMRKSFFTILLRAGMDYNGTNLENCLYNNAYTRTTKLATQKFIEGHTWYKGNAYGWVSTMAHAKPDNIKTLLTRRPINEKKVLEFAANKLNLTKEQLIEEYRKMRKEEASKALAAKAGEKKDEPTLTAEGRISTPVEGIPAHSKKVSVRDQIFHNKKSVEEVEQEIQ